MGVLKPPAGSFRVRLLGTGGALAVPALRGNAEVTGLVQDGAGHVRVDLIDRTTDETETLLADYVLGCDGANSVARTAIGSGMHDLQF